MHCSLMTSENAAFFRKAFSTSPQQLLSLILSVALLTTAFYSLDRSVFVLEIISSLEKSYKNRTNSHSYTFYADVPDNILLHLLNHLCLQMFSLSILFSLPPSYIHAHTCYNYYWDYFWLCYVACRIFSSTTRDQTHAFHSGSMES